MSYKILKLGKSVHKDALEQLVQMHSLCFPYDAVTDRGRRTVLKSWNNPPIMNYWTADEENRVLGYVKWVEHGGIRTKAVIELEQIAVHPDYRERNIATDIIDVSLGELSEGLKKNNREIKLVYLTTGNNNLAQKLYNKTLGAEAVAEIPSFYEDSEMNANEVIMIARKDTINETRKKRRLDPI